MLCIRPCFPRAVNSAINLVISTPCCLRWWRDNRWRLCLRTPLCCQSTEICIYDLLALLHPWLDSMETVPLISIFPCTLNFSDIILVATEGEVCLCQMRCVYVRCPWSCWSQWCFSRYQWYLKQKEWENERWVVWCKLYAVECNYWSSGSAKTISLKARNKNDSRNVLRATWAQLLCGPEWMWLLVKNPLCLCRFTQQSERLTTVVAAQSFNSHQCEF